MIKSINPAALLFEDTRKTAVFSERRSKYVAKNINGKCIQGYRIDGVLIIEGIKCDNGLAIPCDEKLYLIELKGSDLCHACDQISETIRFLDSKNVHTNYYARIVLTKVNGPDVESTQYKKLSKILRDKGGNLKKECIIMEENI